MKTPTPFRLLPGICLAASFLFAFVSLCAQEKAKPIKGYGNASYTLAEAEHQIENWLVAGPVRISASGEPTTEAQQAFFKENMGAVPVSKKRLAPLVVGGKSYEWQLVRASENIVDLDKLYSSADFAAAYAMAEITCDKEVKTVLGVGSDDAIRIWVNGKLIHDQWVLRGLSADNDFVPITLQPGSNQILLKVQDAQQGWAFSVRILNVNERSKALANASGSGNMELVNLLLGAGADPTYKDESGLTVLHHARLGGQTDVARLLIEKGAVETPLPPLESMVSGLYKSRRGKEAPGVTVLVASGAQVLYKDGFGYADIANKRPATPDTKFRIGSITKQFAAASILKLQEDGRISVNDKLSKFIPDFPRGDEVTIHHLLTHTSGIHSYTGKPQFVERVTSPVTEEEVIAFFKDDPYDFSPGDQFLYNNSAYFLLGYIIRKVSGQSFGEYLKETFFDPIGMRNSGVHCSTLSLENEAKGYGKENDAYTSTVSWEMSWAGAAGALYSTVGDLHLWNEALFGGKVLKEESLKAAFTPVTLNDGSVSTPHYGYGWAISEYRGRKVLSHSGGLHGFISQLAYYPDDKLTVVILTNQTPPEVHLDPNKIAEFALWEKMNETKARVLDETVSEDVAPYVGRYNFGQGMVMIITQEGNNLFAKLSSQPRFPIFPAGNGEYFWKVVNARIKFVKNENGEVEHALFEQNGNKLKVNKLKDRPIVSIDRSLYKVYAGKYTYKSGLIVNVTAEGDKIFAQATNQPKFELLPVSDDEFIVEELNASVQFVKENDGVARTLILNFAGNKEEGTRSE